jgi:hypothetical protein
MTAGRSVEFAPSNSQAFSKSDALAPHYPVSPNGGTTTRAAVTRGDHDDQQMDVRGTKATMHNAFFASTKYLRKSFNMYPQDGTVIRPKVFKLVESAYRPHKMPSRHEMRKQLKDLVGKRFKTSSDAFQTLDIDHDARITPEDVGNFLRQRFHIRYSDQEVADCIFGGESHMRGR